MKKLLRTIRWLYGKFQDTRGEVLLNSPHNDNQSGVYISKRKAKAGGHSMKKQEPIKLINITQSTDKSALQKQITEKISKIITWEYNNT